MKKQDCRYLTMEEFHEFDIKNNYGTYTVETADGRVKYEELSDHKHTWHKEYRSMEDKDHIFNQIKDVVHYTSNSEFFRYLNDNEILPYTRPTLDLGKPYLGLDIDEILDLINNSLPSSLPVNTINYSGCEEIIYVFCLKTNDPNLNFFVPLYFEYNEHSRDLYDPGYRGASLRTYGRSGPAMVCTDKFDPRYYLDNESIYQLIGSNDAYLTMRRPLENLGFDSRNGSIYTSHDFGGKQTKDYIARLKSEGIGSPEVVHEYTRNRIDRIKRTILKR